MLVPGLLTSSVAIHLDGRRVDDGKIELFVRRAQMNEQIEGAIEDVIDHGIRTIDLIDHHDRFMAERERFPEHEGGLGHRDFLGIDQNKHPIHHAEGPFDFAAEVGMAWRVDDVDFHSVDR